MPLSQYIDSVVMLTWSDWHKEARSNRYHYAKRFAKEIPTFFVQPKPVKYWFIEKSEIDNLYLIEIPNNYSAACLDRLTMFLKNFGVSNPLLWVYNSIFSSWISKVNKKLVVYHATEAYLTDDFPGSFAYDEKLYDGLISTIEKCDLLISVSKGIEKDYMEKISHTSEHLVISNGCDYHFYAPDEKTLEQMIQARKSTKTILYQGTIYNKIDFALLKKLIQMMPDWQFIFCGNVFNSHDEWLKIEAFKNVTYLGIVNVEELGVLMQSANVGIIPFVSLDYIKKRSLPLKAFEYLASALPTVTVPIDALLPYSDVFYFAQTAEMFKEKIIEAATLSTDRTYLGKIMQAAKSQDYDHKFQLVTQKIEQLLAKKKQLTEAPVLENS